MRDQNINQRECWARNWTSTGFLAQCVFMWVSNNRNTDFLVTKKEITNQTAMTGEGQMSCECD